ncbi:MAG: AAA family ATPase [Gammaproteobacteria bacterium]|nr:AAA family ATPase [Gammaproteobacteria bacterium]
MSDHFFKSVKIENFRGIKSLEISDLARVNLFVGENNCGKTTVLEAAFLLAGIGNPNLIINMQNGRGLTLVDGSDIKDFFYERHCEKGLTLSGVQVKGERNLEVLPQYGDLQAAQMSGIAPVIPENGGLKRAQKLGVDASVAGQSLIGLRHQFTVANPVTGKSEQYQAGTRWIEVGNIQFAPFFDPRYKESIRGEVLYLRRGYNHASVDRMLNEKKRDLLLSTLKSIDSKVVDIKTGSHGLVSVDISIDSFIPINLLGDGIVRILNVVSEINRASNGILTVDEIENGLHVNALKRVWEVILNQSGKSYTQIFLTTHSQDAIKGLRAVLDESKNEFSDAVACYRLVKFPDDVVRAYRYSGEQLGMALDSHTDIRV